MPVGVASDQPDEPSAPETTSGSREVATAVEDIAERMKVALNTPFAPTTNRATQTKNTSKRVTEKGAREGRKTRRVIELLKREGGVTLKEPMTEMGWQSHTTRALDERGRLTGEEAWAEGHIHPK